MKPLHSAIVYENPLPQLRSRQSAFPFACETKDGRILVSHVIGEAFESVDGTTYVSESADGGVTFSAPRRMFAAPAAPRSDCSKITALPDGRVIALGYAFERPDPELALGNPETGGLLDDFIFYALSEDGGRTFGEVTPVPCSFGPHVEASAPVTVLRDGTLATPITNFPGWDGKLISPREGRLLRSTDGVKWTDEAVCMAFPGNEVTCYEQRMCQTESGALVVLGWNENAVTGERMQNHFTYSLDNGATFSAPCPTGVMGQASSVCAIGGEKILALHALRRDTDRPGIYGCIVDFSDHTWRIVEQTLIWEPATPVTRMKNMAEIFAFLKFGQPGAILLKNGDALMTHWYCQDGQYRSVATRIQL